MSTYKIYDLHADGRTDGPPHVISSADDLDAIYAAHARATSCDQEIWQGTRLVAVVKPGDEPEAPAMRTIRGAQAAARRADCVRTFGEMTVWNAAMAADMHYTVTATRALIERSREAVREAERLLAPEAAFKSEP